MKRFLCGLAVLCLFLGAMAQARSDFIYWTDLGGGDIRRANLDGSGGHDQVRANQRFELARRADRHMKNVRSRGR
jgi:hypothetical protein